MHPVRTTVTVPSAARDPEGFAPGTRDLGDERRKGRVAGRVPGGGHDLAGPEVDPGVRNPFPSESRPGGECVPDRVASERNVIGDEDHVGQPDEEPDDRDDRRTERESPTRRPRLPGGAASSPSGSPPMPAP